MQVVEERDEDGVLQARYDYGDMDLQKLYRRASNGTYLSRWYLGDGLESTRQLVDANGVVTDSYAYDAFGSTLQRAGETENTRLYNGQQQDDSGLYFLRARYYNSGNGRFLSHDPLLGNNQDPITLHRYLYCANDPVNFIDPSGEESLGSMMSAIGINTVLTARVASVAMNVLGAADTMAAVFNIYSDYTATGSVNGWDVATAAAGIILPVAGSKVLKSLFRTWRETKIYIDGMRTIGRAGSLIARRKDFQRIKDILGGTVQIVKDADDLINEMEMLEAGAMGAARINAAFREGVIYLRSKATRLELFHEAMHAKQYLDEGRQAYYNLSRLAREEYVYNAIKRAGGFTKEELEATEVTITYYRKMFGGS